METLVNFIDGRFGHKVLVPKYRRIWKAITKSTLISIAIIIFFMILQAIQYCTDFINYVYWGIM